MRGFMFCTRFEVGWLRLAVSLSRLAEASVTVEQGPGARLFLSHDIIAEVFETLKLPDRRRGGLDSAHQ
eukprot:2982469-Amphidinium_carterae.1